MISNLKDAIKVSKHLCAVKERVLYRLHQMCKILGSNELKAVFEIRICSQDPMTKMHLLINHMVQHTLAKRSRKVAEAPTCAISRNRIATSVVYTFCYIAGGIALKTKISQVTICQVNNQN